jgi:flagellar biosynthesis protein FliR
MSAPGLAVPGLDWRFRIGLVAVLGAVMDPAVATQFVAHAGWPAFLWAVLAELLTGSLLGWTAGLIIAGARCGGELVAAHAGLSTAALFDVESGEEMTPLGYLYSLMAMAAFLALDGPLAMVRALHDSYAAIPVGSLVVSEQTAVLAFGQVGHALELALRVAAPPAIALVMASIVLGWLGRTAPALPIFALALPIRACLGVVLVFLSLATLVVTLTSAWDAVLSGPWWAAGSR